jgi:hypothetical protein
MSVTSSDLLAAADKAFKHADSEADWRGVCSRSYYSIYQDGKVFHESLPSPGRLVERSNAGMHGDLIEQLKHPTIDSKHKDHMRSKQVGHLMATLHASRIKSDYKRASDLTEKEAQDSIAHARRVFEILNSNLPPPPKMLTPSASTFSDVANPEVNPSPRRPTLSRIK